MNNASSSIRETTVRSPWLAVMAVGLATFSVVTTEMLPVGLLTPIAESLGTSPGVAGLTLSLPALLAALFALIVVIASGGVDRRRILCVLLSLLVVANVASALSPGIGWLLAARILVGFCMGGIWAIAGGLAARLVPTRDTGLATSIIFGGVAAASVLGVPFGALLGDIAGWRWAFSGMALLSGLVLLFLMMVVPALPVENLAPVRPFRELRHNRMLQAGLLLTLLLVAGHFMAFTFVRPLLLSVSGFNAQWTGMLLFTYGVAGIVGNFLSGIIAARRTTMTLLIIALGLLLTPLLFLTVGDSHVGGGTTLLVWGLAYGGVSVGLMTWMMKAVPDAIEIATALYVGVFNIGIAFGSWTGGLVMDTFGLRSMLCLTALSAAAALFLVIALCLNNPTNIPDIDNN